MKDVILENDGNPVSTGPILVRLEYVLVRTNVSIESFIRLALKSPSKAAFLLLVCCFNFAKLKARVATAVPLQAEQLPYDREVLSLIKDLPGPVYLLSSASQLHVDQIAKHLSFVQGAYRFENDQLDVRQLKQDFGSRGFAFIGRSMSDLPIWKIAEGGYAVRPTQRLRRAIGTLSNPPVIVERGQSRMRFWMRLFGARQYYRLLFSLLPIAFLTTASGGLFEVILVFSSLLLAMSIGSFIRHVLNIQADRGHPVLKATPLAAGNVQIGAALALFIVLVGTVAVMNVLIYSWISALISLATAMSSAVLADSYRRGWLSFATSTLLDLFCIFGPGLVLPILSPDLLLLQVFAAVCALLLRFVNTRARNH